MAQRLQMISNQIRQIPTFVDSSFDYFDFTSHLTSHQNDVRLKVRKFVETEAVPTIHSYVDQAKFPQHLIPKLRQLDPLEYLLEKPYGNPLSTAGKGILIAELSRGDASIATLCTVHYGIFTYSIQALGSEKQKQYFLPKCRKFQILGGFGLTQQKIGSDASNLQTTVTKISPDTYKINGNKRWIGNGNKDYLITWAKNTQTKKIQGYIVDNKLPGVSSYVIKNKLALRMVQNCHINLNNVIVNEDSKLPKAKDFGSGVNKVLEHSRVFVCWIAAGMCMGVYDNMIKYVSNRKQFGQAISGFQLVQQKIVKVMSHTTAVLSICFQLSKMVDQKKANIAKISMVKAYVTSQLREIAKWGRQVMGGNGILHQNHVMKMLADAQAIYTYQGTYEVNTLVAGRQLTGLNAFKK